MNLKKILCVLICISILLSGACFTVFAEDITVPYTPNQTAFSGNRYKIDDILDVKRLLELKKEFFDSSFDLIIEDEELRSLAIEYVYEFIEENPDLIAKPEKSYAKERSDIEEGLVAVYINWDTSLGDQYNIKPCIKSMEQLYDELSDCHKDENYDRVFLLAPEFYDWDSYQNSKLDQLIAEFEEKYGDVLTGYIDPDGHYYLLEGATFTHYVYIKISHYRYREKEKADELKRYNRILKNNTILPVTEDTNEKDKLLIITNSISNIYHSYMVTNLPTQNVYTKEKSYSTGMGQCHHYATITKELCDLYDIPCIYISGQSDGVDHAWNIIQYNGNWYHADLTGQRVKPYDLDIEDLTLVLCSDEEMEQNGYDWDKTNYPECLSERIELAVDGFSYSPEITDSCINVEMFEPYFAQDPMTTYRVFYNILFDTAEGKILKINTNLSGDNYQKINGQWVKKETILEIPSEINGVKVRAIASYADCERPIGNFDHMYIPDDIIIEEFAFRGVATTHCQVKNLHIGNNVIIGYDSLPNYTYYHIGENVVYMGHYLHANYGSYPLHGSYWFNSYQIRFCEDENITVPEGYANLIYVTGNNIVDKIPSKTLTLNDDLYYVDPRLGRLNRRYVVSEDNPNYTEIDGVLYNKDMTELISVPVGIEELIIPDTVTKIGPKALEYNNALKTIIFPEGVTSFGKEAFCHLSNIETVIFKGMVPDSFEAILCSDFELYSLADLNAELVEANIVSDELVVTNSSSIGGEIYVAFYDIKGKLIEIGQGPSVKIPAFAKNYKIFVFDDDINPIALKKSGSVGD